MRRPLRNCLSCLGTYSGTIIRTEGSGRTELLGGYIYSVRKQNDIYEAAFETVNATSSLYWMYANTGSGSYFPFLFNETQGAIRRSVVVRYELS